MRDVEPGELIVIDENTVRSGTFSTLRLPQKFGVSQVRAKGGAGGRRRVRARERRGGEVLEGVGVGEGEMR